MHQQLILTEDVFFNYYCDFFFVIGRRNLNNNDTFMVITAANIVQVVHSMQFVLYFDN